MIKIIHGNLLEAPVEALVNTVNTVGVMGKGIALQFKRAFPQNFKAYAAAVKADQVSIGKMFVYDNGVLSQPRFIINFPTKQHWRNASQLAYIDAGLEDLVQAIHAYGIHSIAVPALGCSNGGLTWNEVQPRIEAALGGLTGVEVHLYAPLATTEPVIELQIPAQKPSLTISRAIILRLFASYTAFGDDLGKLEAQKLAYFVQNSGFDLKLAFVKQQYGPYADALNHVLLRLEGHYLKGFGDRQQRSHIQILPGVIDDAEALFATDPLATQAIERVMDLIHGFETPYGMELLATVHWVATHEGAHDLAAARNAVQRWNDRKNSTFGEHHIRAAWLRLQANGWLELQPASH
jgi:O-acetyl-ADP-ribose deacetylase (regulator of RNase III)